MFVRKITAYSLFLYVFCGLFCLHAMELGTGQQKQIKVVFTGGPCVGKTSLIKALEALDYYVVREVATDIIKGKVKGLQIHPTVVGPDLFQKAVCAEQKKREEVIAQQQDKQLWFLDRGMPDGAGYYKNAGLRVPQELQAAIQNFRYDLVFILDPVPYVKDGFVRKEDSEEAH